MKLVSVQEIQDFERANAEETISYAQMMENAGRATALAIRRCCPDAPTTGVLVLVGPGNNGGDGLVAARYLQQWGYPCSVYIWHRDLQEDPNLAKVQELDVALYNAAEDEGYAILAAQADKADVLIDALLGTGGTGPLRGTLPELLAVIKDRFIKSEQPTLYGANAILAAPATRKKRLIFAVDVPSGLNCDSGEIDERALPADYCVTFAFPKRGQVQFPGANYVGQLIVADIGTDPALAKDVDRELAISHEAAEWLPQRPANSHKGTYGKAMIVAGSANYVGAPRLASLAAYRVGAGLVTLGLPQSIYNVVAAALTEPTFLLLSDDMGVLTPEAIEILRDKLPGYDALLVGPGLGTETPTKHFVQSLIARKAHSSLEPIGFASYREEKDGRFNLPALVIDADGLNLLAQWPQWPQHLPAGSILTPHPGEMARLTGKEITSINADRVGTARRYAQAWNCIVVLKGAFTVVADGQGRTTVIPFADPALATAGSGDVLAGAITGLLAQGVDAYRAAICGAYLHGLAAQLRPLAGDAGMLAGDLLPLLPQAMARLRELDRNRPWT